MKKKMTLLHHNQLGSRYYSKMKEYHSLLFDLIETISTLHSRYRTVIFDRILVEECEEMINDIMSGEYQLSPILFYHIEVDEYESFCQRKTAVSLAFCGLLRFYAKKKAGYLNFSRPSTDRDVLLIAVLEQLLLDYSVEWKCSSIEDLVYDFHSDIKKEMVHVRRIYHLDKDYLPEIGLFLKRVSSINLQYDTHTYQYITSFLNLSYIDKYGLCHESMNGTYIVCDLSRIVLNLLLKEILDSEFRNVFPGIAFTRFVNQVIIGTKDIDEVLFNEEEGYALLKSTDWSDCF